LRDMVEKNTRLILSDIFVYSQSECDEAIVHLDFLFETESLTDKIRYDDLQV